ncbi:hypothetical protein BGZ63DRAFT_479490 [Mariannaea sp. PMI_226]|nr:hypothetical protein BGZ63DRAFT_479490 [Mariannaea sp. PMI_226]
MDSPKPDMDLEKELTCSICTELLYQPLTLLDCLHTFCGACLKEWFSFQAATAERSPNPPAPGTPIFTCPSCRSPVRDTRPNATFVTLLDMFVAANPDKDRSAAEKEEMAGKYKPGEQVLPKLPTRERTAEERRADDEDRRLLDEVREMSLRDAGVSTSLPPRAMRRDSRDDRPRLSREQSSDSRQRRNGHRPRREEASRQNSDHGYTESERRHRRSESRQRQIEHQSSIRSLISSADMSERDIEREIEDFARQIQDEGLLDGLDLDNIDLSRDDELSRRITEAYRRRQRERARHEATRRNHQSSGHTSSSRPTETMNVDTRLRASEGSERQRSRTRPHSRSASATSQTEERTRPPPSASSASSSAVSSEIQESNRRTRRRTASDSRSATVPIFPTAPETRPAARSSTDLTLRSQTSDPTAPRSTLSESRASTTQVISNVNESSVNVTLGSNLSFANRAPQGPPQNGPNGSNSIQPSSSHQDPIHQEPGAGRGRINRPPDLNFAHTATLSPNSSPTTAGPQRPRAQVYAEPSINCARCNKQHIEYELHYSCGICANGQWNICLDCYRSGKGCLYWFGFGHGAWVKWEKKRQQAEGPIPRPHILTASRYLRPRVVTDGRKLLSMEDPRKRLESGTFCAKCLAWTNECYWRCDTCNEGEWGFCNDCVNQGRSCTHPLLPLAHEATQPPHGRPVSPRSPGRPPTATLLTGPNASSVGSFKPLTFTCRCDVCQEPIPPSQARYHCYSCTSSLVSEAAPGDYDICSSCYGNLVAVGQISKENGHSGWRRCLHGHRMVVVAFTDGKVGQWRYVAKDLVGGRSLRSEAPERQEHQAKGLQKWTWQNGDHTLARLITRDVSDTAPTSDGSTTFSQQLPPDGGVGLRGNSRWAWYPKAGSDDELMFPRGAEIKEIEDVNGDWFFGSYMGSRGLFPAPYVRLEQRSQGEN